MTFTSGIIATGEYSNPFASPADVSEASARRLGSLRRSFGLFISGLLHDDGADRLTRERLPELSGNEAVDDLHVLDVTRALPRREHGVVEDQLLGQVLHQRVER